MLFLKIFACHFHLDYLAAAASLQLQSYYILQFLQLLLLHTIYIHAILQIATDQFYKKIFKAKWTFVYDWIHRLFFIYSCSYNQFIYAILLLKYGSEEKGSSLYKCSILLGFIMSKNLRCLWFYLLIKVQNATSLVFWHRKTQENRAFIESRTLLLRSIS